MTFRSGGRLQRITWFVGLWLAGVGAVAVLAWLLRAAIGVSA